MKDFFSIIYSKNFNVFFFTIDNSNDHWQTELMSLAQQIQTSLKTTDDLTTSRTRSSRVGNINSGRLSRRSTIRERSDQRLNSKRSFSRSSYHPIRLPKSEIMSEKPFLEPTNEQDHGIWVTKIFAVLLFVLLTSEWFFFSYYPCFAIYYISIQ